MRAQPWQELERLTPERAAYFAGLVDGEGCIRAKKQNTRYDIYYPLLSIQMKTKEPLVTVGTWLNWPPHTTGRGYARLDFMGKRAMEVLPQIRPYLVLKGDQADLAMELGTLGVGRGHGNIPSKGVRSFTPQATLDRMAVIAQELSDLKRRPS